MKGFELSVNGKKKAAFFKENRVICLVIDLLALNDGSCRLRFGGSDSTSNYKDTSIWMDTFLELGDEVSLTIKELEEESQPCVSVASEETPTLITPEKAVSLRKRYHILEQMLASCNE